ncbi:MAG: type II secretion system F family protein [Atopobiaceae bacterium]|nr:type II secretion system F family protein [Atopobiaceae bacterium]
METARIVTCATLAWIGAYVGIGALGNTNPGWQATYDHVAFGAASAVRRLGGGRLSCALLEVECISSFCDELVGWFAGRGRLVTRNECCGLLIVCVAVTTLLCVAWSRSLLGSVAPLVAWGTGIAFWDSSHKAKRSEALSAEMPDVFRTLAMALGAGETLAQAITYVGENQGGIAGTAFMNASMRLRCGMTVQEALRELVGELDAPGVELLATALSISQRTGSPLRSLFQQSALLVERQGDFERLLSVKTAQVRLSARVVSVLPVVMVATLSLISPDFQRGIMTAPGMVSLTLAAVMDAVALLIIRKLMKGVL